MEMKTWQWRIDYTIQLPSGEYREEDITVTASTLLAAFTRAGQQIAAGNPGIIRYKIWNVGIVTETDAPEEVF